MVRRLTVNQDDESSTLSLAADEQSALFIAERAVRSSFPDVAQRIRAVVS